MAKVSNGEYHVICFPDDEIDEPTVQNLSGFETSEDAEQWIEYNIGASSRHLYAIVLVVTIASNRLMFDKEI